ncbi:hypothetical protein AOLI_G00003360 [Acnodon oligacanthus]
MNAGSFVVTQRGLRNLIDPRIPDSSMRPLSVSTAWPESIRVVSVFVNSESQQAQKEEKGEKKLRQGQTPGQLSAFKARSTDPQTQQAWTDITPSAWNRW